MLLHPLTSILMLALPFVSGRQQKSQNNSSDKRRSCGLADKKKFNENLLNLFRAEYGKELTADSDSMKILNWKFESLDRNDDDYLQRPEYKPLRRLKRLVKPRKCAKTFARACDRDRDSRISKKEWSSCLGVDLRRMTGSNVVGLSEHNRRKDEPEVNDCQSDRQTVLAEHLAHELYVPECAADGRYRKVQCYKSTGYCWCVREDDGEPIPGTSVKDKQPDCDKVPMATRSIKGCPADKKQIFLQHLATFLRVNDSVADVVAVTFANFDANNNNFLERREWKSFRAIVAAQKLLRRCGKKLPRFCDVNNDRRISITEWTHCLGGSSANETSEVSVPRRRGPNPIKTILRDD